MASRDCLVWLERVAGDSRATRLITSTSTSVRCASSKAHLFVAVDHTSKFAFASLYCRATTLTAATFLKALVQTVPHRIYMVPTNTGVRLSGSGKPRSHVVEQLFGRVCQACGIEHRLAKHYPWTNS